jgi:hypothetical protein
MQRDMSKDMTGAAGAELEADDEFGIGEAIIYGLALLFMVFWIVFILAIVALAVIRVATRLF